MLVEEEEEEEAVLFEGTALEMDEVRPRRERRVSWRPGAEGAEVVKAWVVGRWEGGAMRREAYREGLVFHRVAVYRWFVCSLLRTDRVLGGEGDGIPFLKCPSL